MSELELLSILTAKAPTGTLPDMPIDPALITAGDPVARGAVLVQSADKKMSAGVWSCEPGEFDWTYEWDEFFYVLEGRVMVTDGGGRRSTVGPGEMAHFPIGVKTHWKVEEPVRKFFLLKTPDPLNL